MGHKSSKHHKHLRNVPSQSQPPIVPKISSIKSDPLNFAQKYPLSNFAVITVVFNPVNYISRYDHYQKFEAHMSQSGVNLITVECIFETASRFGLAEQKFEITRANDRRHIQLVAPSIMWLKENLINIAIKRLPQNIEYVAWLDADIEFERLDWPHLTIAELQRYPIVQLFELSFFLGPQGKRQILRRDYSFAYSIKNNKPIDPKRYDEWYPHPGYAWAMRRSAYDSIGGLLDFCIIGSGDLHFAYALVNRIEDTIRHGLDNDYRRLALQWQERVARVAQNGANVGYVPINLWHYWHGTRNDRNYVDRWVILEKHQFSPIRDLQKNDETSLLRLIDKTNYGEYQMAMRMEALELDIVEYFKSRNEDNSSSSISKQLPHPIKGEPFRAAKTQPHRKRDHRPSKFPSHHRHGIKAPHLWTSGPAGTHVDDDESPCDQCTCHGDHHPDNHDCPCSSYHIDDEHCWEQSGYEQHGHYDEHSQHHYEGHHEHQYHEDWSNINDPHYSQDYSSGGGFEHTEYGGPGTFY